MGLSKQLLISTIKTIVAIYAAGAILNLANRGKLGAQAQAMANTITSGYGAGAL